MAIKQKQAHLKSPIPGIGLKNGLKKPPDFYGMLPKSNSV